MSTRATMTAAINTWDEVDTTPEDHIDGPPGPIERPSPLAAD